MASSPPSRAEHRQGGVFYAFAVFGAFLLLGILTIGELFHGLMAGGAAFLVHRQLLVRGWLLADHNRGVSLAKSGNHAGALEAFRASEAAWNRRSTLDRWRAPLLASAARWTFADQARYNQALCLHHLDRPTEALSILVRLVEREPKMGMARALLEHLEANPATQPEEEHGWDDLEAALDPAT
jgi:hypothetical protein